MRKLITILFLIAFSKQLYADSGIYQSYIILNNVTNQYYDAPDFNGTNLGTYTVGDSFFFKGGETKTWKNNGGDITGAFIYYRIYVDGGSVTSFTELNLPWTENNVDGNSNNQKWTTINANNNILSGLAAGNYKIEVYFKATTNEGDKFFNNSGANYIANFTVVPAVDEIILNNKVTISPALPTRSQPITVTLDATGTALETASKIYFHSGVGTDIPDSNQFNNAVGNWGLDDEIGEMTRIGTTNKWTIMLTSIDTYFSLGVNDDTFGLNFLFRNETGNSKEDNAGNNYHLTLNPENYFVITAPNYSPFLVETLQNFTISAEANTSAIYTLKELDENGEILNPAINTSSTQNYYYSHSLSNIGTTHYYQLSVNFGTETKTKNFEIKSYGAITQETLPSGAKKGINYNFPSTNLVTFVLHTPTNTTYKYFDNDNCENTSTSTSTTTSKNVVHLIGDFNNWEINSNYQLKKDGDYWWITLNVTSLLPIQNEYVFQYLVDGQIRIGDPYSTKISDADDKYIPSTVYPNLALYPTGKTSGRASVLEVNELDYVWQNPSFNRTISSNNLNIYELHFRDFTEEGTYKAATAKLDYIKNLGINCIHVMPVSEFEGNTSWGYNPNYYFATDKTYGTENDLKEFIDEAHSRGIAVVNDLVLNHAFYSNPMAMLYWNNDLNRPANDNPWFNPEHKGIYDSNGHWGADWNHSSEHTQNMVDDILNYWIEEFKFDGFRFDFTKGFTQTAPNPSDPWASNYDNCRVEILKRMVSQMWTTHSNTYAIFEHLANDSEDKALADYGILMWSGAGPQESWAEMAMGTNIKSFWSSAYSSRNFNLANYMSYMESHDEERIGYKVKTWGLNNDNSTKYLANRLKLPAAFNMLLPGPRMVWQFGELGYDISIDENGRTGDKQSAWELNYNTDTDRQQIYNLYNTIFKFRNRFELYHANSFPEAISTIDYGNIGSTTDWVRRMSFSDGTDNGVNNQTQVIVVGNFSTTTDSSINPGYYFTGDYYKYNGDPLIDGTKYTVNSTSDSFNLFKTDPVYILSNADIIDPKITPITINVNSPSACNYKISNGDTQYDFIQENWVANLAPTMGKASDNGNISKIYYSKINGVDILNKPNSLANVTLEIGTNEILWNVTDGFGNIASCTQIINVSTVESFPTINVINPGTISQGTTATLQIKNPNLNYTYKWFLTENQINPIYIGNSYTTSALTSSTTIYVKAIDNISLCSSEMLMVSVEVSSTLGFNDFKPTEHNLIPYPNPTTGEIEILIPNSVNDVTIELYNNLSQLISKRNYPIISGKVQLNLSEFSNGLYIAKVHLNKPIILKILKQ